MKKIMILAIVLNSFLWASGSDESDEEKKKRTERQIQIEMEREKKFSREQTFYQGKDYDLKGAEVNEDTVESLTEIPVDNLDMNDVYD